MNTLELEHAEIEVDDEGWLRIKKRNGEELAFEMLPGDRRKLIEYLQGFEEAE